MSVALRQRRRLGTTGIEVSGLGFGAAPLGNLYRAVSDKAARATLDAAIAAGITYVDTAPHYGQGLSERRIGAALPEGILLSTKVGRVLEPIATLTKGTERHGFVDGDPFEPHFDYTGDGIRRSFEDSLKRLGRDHVDILLVHDIGEMTHGADAARHMRDFLDSGYKTLAELKATRHVSAIGLGINECRAGEDVLNQADIDVILLAGRYTLLEQGALDRLLPLCEARGTAVIAAGPFNSGVLSGGAYYNYGAVPPEVAKRVTALRDVCAAHAVPVTAAALQFPLAHPAVVCVLAGMASPQEVAANVSDVSAGLPAALWDDLKSAGLIDARAPVPAKVAA